MIIDSRDIDRDTALEADVCVIGGGAAGITVALQLADGPGRVLLLEGGSTQYEQTSQELYGGPEEGTLIDSGSLYLLATRQRYFGGTTNHWHGWCRPLDAEDFEPRDWVPHSGWPIALSDVEPYYPRACELLQISPFDYDQATAGAFERLLDGDDVFETNFFHLSPPTRFALEYRAPLEKAENVEVVTNANVRRIEVDADARHVTHLDVVRADASPLPVRARQFVLATGGIENARLLLNSRSVQKNGLGNDHDVVGRFFMEHPLQRIGAIVMPERRTRVPKTYSKSYVRSRKNWIRGVIRPTAEAQRRHRLLNTVMLITPMKQSEIGDLTIAVERLAQDLGRLADLPRPEQEQTGYFGWIHIHSEQCPNAESRVGLADDEDRLGVRRTRLQWPLGEMESSTIRRTAQLFGEQIGSRLDGRCLVLPEEPLWSQATWSNHHMGTTRMGDDPTTSVVDSRCRVHGVDNLYVAGSSVFPTVGSSNPTLTIVALALRISDDLKGASV